MSISHTDVIKSGNICICVVTIMCRCVSRKTYCVQMCFEKKKHIMCRCVSSKHIMCRCDSRKNILCADVFCVFNWFETIQHQPSARRFGEEKLPWFTEAITNDLTNNGDVDDQLNALFRIKGHFRGQERCFLKDQ